MLSDAYDGDDEAGGERRGKMERVTEREGRGEKKERGKLVCWGRKQREK